MNRSKISKLLTGIVCLAMLVSCSTSNTDTSTTDNVSTITSTVTSDMITYDENDFYSDWKNESPNYIELNNTEARLKGSGAEIDGSKITITTAGVYVLSGKLDNGQIIVDVEDKETVKLVLNGAEINCSDNAPIYVKNAEKIIISLVEGTQNIVKDGETYNLSDTDEPNAAIFSKGDLTINGTGSLTVDGNYNNGITSKDSLKITAGNINITSKDDGLMGKDMLLVKDGNITIEAGGDAVKSTNDTDTSKGFVGIQGGTFNLKAGADGIQAETAVLISDGNFNISTNGGSINGVAKSGDNNQGPMGNKDKTATTTTDETESQSAKGIKSSADIEISGGIFKIDSSDDAIHSSNSATIAGGNLSIASGDDG
ncbi:MAG TPA: carbohydrate-binding domain-containing protein, partial [Clostridium sp.]